MFTRFNKKVHCLCTIVYQMVCITSFGGDGNPCRSVSLSCSPAPDLPAHRTSPLVYTMLTAKSLQPCPTLCDPIDGSPPGSPIPGILQARTLEWVAISFSNAWMWKMKVKLLSCVQLFATPWTTAYQAPPSMEFSRQECWSGVPLPSLMVQLVVLKVSDLRIPL